MKRRAFLDRALVLSLSIDRVSLPYALAALRERMRACYEAAGMSAVESALRSHPELARRVTPVRGDLRLDEEAKLRVANYLERSLDEVEVSRELDHFHQMANLPASRARESLAYAARLVLLAQRYNATAILWPKRGPLILELLTGAVGQTSEVNGLRTYTADLTDHPLRTGHDPTVEFVLGPVDRDEGSEMSRVRVFVCYSHADNDATEPNRRWVDRLLLHLRIGELANSHAVWSDSDIETGGLWDERIAAAIGSADVAVLIVSPAFLASKYIREREMPPILARMRADRMFVIPLLVRACGVDRALYDYVDPNEGARSFHLSELQFANSLDRPLNALQESEQDALLTMVSHDIHEKLRTAAPC